MPWMRNPLGQGKHKGIETMKMGIYSFGGCEGCRYWLIDSILQVCEELDVNIVYEPLIGLAKESPEYDIVIVEGAACTEEDVKKLRSLRSRTRFLVALGSCAVLGGVPGNKRFTDLRAIEMVYLGKPLPKKPVDVKPITDHVKVDYWIRGCPPNRENFENIFRAILSSIASGEPFKLYERRLEFCRDEFIKIKGNVIKFDGDKCINCGRCVSVCERMGICAIDFAYRSINTTVTTPFTLPFEESTCVFCGQCTLICPVGAIRESSSLEDVQKKLSRNATMRVYVEPESLAALSGYFNRDIDVIVGALIARGFESVAIYLPEYHVDAGRPLIPMSETERRFVNMFYPGLAKMLSSSPAPPSGPCALITPCIAKKAQISDVPVLTTREAIRLISGMDLDEVEEKYPVMPSRRIESYKEVSGPNNVKRFLDECAREPRAEEPVILKLCPGGCLGGGGQPYYREDLYRKMSEILAEIYSERLVVK